MLRSLAALVLAVGAVACAGAPPQATPIDALRAHVALAQLQEGRSLLLRKCSGCHATPSPRAHLATEWPTALGEMSERAHLDLTERGMIEQYLVVMAAK